MERLTERELYDSKVCFTKCAHTNCPDKCVFCHIPDEANEKLKEYEDLEEQGLLVKLPCKVGDTIYVKIGTSSYVNLDVLDFVYYRSCGFYIVCGYYDTPKCAMPLSDLGKNFFLTKEQADQVLK